MTATDLLRAAQEENEKGKEHNTYTSYERKSSAHMTDVNPHLSVNVLHSWS